MLLPAIQLGIPLLLALSLWFWPQTNRLALLLQAATVAAVIIAVWTAGIWTIVPRWLLLPIAAFAAFGAVKAGRQVPSKTSFLGWIQLLIFLALLIVGFWMLGEQWRGRQPPPGQTIDLAMPVDGEGLIVGSGGSTLLINAHQDTLDLSIPRHRLWQGQSYAVDLVALHPHGTTASGLMPSDPERYAIFGRGVRAPCAGTVKSLRNDQPDQKVPQMDRRAIEGNFVRLTCGAYEVFMAHLQQGSVAVQVGQKVAVGDLIAAVGNSGLSTEPHLHIHAQTPGTASAPNGGKPVAMLFNGRFLARNDRI
jgi:Peptidase family M23